MQNVRDEWYIVALHVQRDKNNVNSGSAFLLTVVFTLWSLSTAVVTQRGQRTREEHSRYLKLLF